MLCLYKSGNRTSNNTSSSVGVVVVVVAYEVTVLHGQVKLAPLSQDISFQCRHANIVLIQS
jgi:hypothetical protein